MTGEHNVLATPPNKPTDVTHHTAFSYYTKVPYITPHISLVTLTKIGFIVDLIKVCKKKPTITINIIIA